MSSLRRFLRSKNCYKNFNILKYSSSSNTASDNWNGLVHKAEKVVGYPISFLNLRWLLNDEIANIAFHITKLIGTNHPIIGIARSLVQQTERPKWGLIVLLISKAAGIQCKVAEIERDVTSGILHNQRALAEVTEMIQTGHSLHKTIIEINNNDNDHKDLSFGNKVALLSGDFLYAKCYHEVAQLRNSNLNHIIATSLRDLAESQFLEPRDAENNPLPTPPSLSKRRTISETDPGPYNLEEYMGNAREEWILRNLLNGANLLAKSCRGTLMLDDHPEFLQDKAYIFGRSLALAFQANEDTKPFLKNSVLPFSLVSAPVIFQLHCDPKMYELFKVSKINYEEIRRKVVEGVGIEKTMDLQMEFVEEALDALQYFSSSDARDSLVKLVRSLEC